MTENGEILRMWLQIRALRDNYTSTDLATDVQMHVLHARIAVREEEDHLSGQS